MDPANVGYISAVLLFISSPKIDRF